MDRWDLDGDPLAALRAGDPRPFEAFVSASAPTFLAFFDRHGAGAAEAEDLTQDVFLKLFRNATHYQPQGRFAAYAFRVARNAWVDQARRRGGALESFRPADADDDAESSPASTSSTGPEADPGRRLARREETERLLDALRGLPDSQRTVFELGVIEELPYAVIAESLEVPVGTVKSRMFHAVRKLRALLGEDPS